MVDFIMIPVTILSILMLVVSICESIWTTWSAGSYFLFAKLVENAIPIILMSLFAMVVVDVAVTAVVGSVETVLGFFGDASFWFELSSGFTAMLEALVTRIFTNNPWADSLSLAVISLFFVFFGPSVVMAFEELIGAPQLSYGYLILVVDMLAVILMLSSVRKAFWPKPHEIPKKYFPLASGLSKASAVASFVGVNLSIIQHLYLLATGESADSCVE
jgi:hypothetical protein